MTTPTLTAFVAKELRIAYRHGRNEGSGGSLPSEDQVVEANTERIVAFVKRWTATREGMTVATVVGYEAGVAKADGRSNR